MSGSAQPMSGDTRPMSGARPVVVVAVDGPAASGKGTLARRLARHFGFALLDTGLLYRAVGLSVLRAGGDPGDPELATVAARALHPERTAVLDDPDLRTDTSAVAASKVAAVPGVRAALLDFQRWYAAHPPRSTRGAVLDGRDIGTVVCPDADAKIFITAGVDVRAGRRLKELRDRGVEAIYEQVLTEMKERDARDSQRAVAPLVPAVDAFVLDTSALDADQAFEAALSFIGSKTDLAASCV